MRLRFGIIGCGTIAARFSEALKKSSSGEAVACAARELSRAEEFAKKHEIKAAYGSYEELLSDESVQAVYIATVHTEHAKLAKMCINAGKAVICEKPLFVNETEAKEVIALAKEKDVLVMEAFWTRTLPAFAKAKEWIKAGKIGDVSLIRAAFCFPMPYIPETKDHRLFNPKLGGGALLDVGVYPYMYATGLMEEYPEDIKITKSMGETGVDLTTGMLLRFKGGAVADLLCSINGSMDETAIISGNAGLIKQYRFYGCTKTELCNQLGVVLETYEDPQDEGFVHEIEHFAKLYASGKKESDLIPLADTLDFAKMVSKYFYEK